LGTDAKKLFDHRITKGKENKNVDMGKYEGMQKKTRGNLDSDKQIKNLRHPRRNWRSYPIQG
jgi:hypothetical protein